MFLIVKSLFFKLLSSERAKEVIIELLEEMVKRTDNTVDDRLVASVKTYLYADVSEESEGSGI